MLELVSRHLYDQFMDYCTNSTSIIRLCTPFIKREITNDLLKNIKTNTKIKLLTNINLMSFYKGASDLASIQQLFSVHASIFTYTSLHAKFYIFDDRCAIITSANLTPSGLKRNLEYGLVTDEITLISSAVRDFDNLCRDQLTGRIKQEHIDTIHNILEIAPRVEHTKLPKLELEFDNVYSADIQPIVDNLSGWKQAVFMELGKLGKDEFTSEDYRAMIPSLQNLYPHNHNVEAKIRQQLQFLRDLGLIQFISKGRYRKLWM